MSISPGNAAIRREFVNVHCEHLHRWYDARGGWRDQTPSPDSRETLWHCTSLLSRRQPHDLRLAQRVLLQVPTEYNGFAPVVTADLLLNHGRQLEPRVRAHLLDLLKQYIVYVIEWRFAGDGLMNFAAMDTYCMLAASRLLRDGYRFEHRYAAAACVYNSHRLATLALNAARLLDYGHSRGSLTAEFNSPTYIPLTLMALAKIANITEPESPTHQLALRAEQAVWRETLSFYHPDLGVSAGPYSRAYVTDIAGQLSLLRCLLLYVGIGPGRSVAKLIDEPHPDLILHHLGHRPFNWANVAWLLTTRYHIPTDARPRPQGKNRIATTTGTAHWSPFGRKVGGRFVPVQGDLLQGGSTRITQHQHPYWCLGWASSLAMTGIHYPIHLHYALRRPVRSMMDVRHVTAAVVMHDRQDALAPGACGQPAQVDILQYAGDVAVTGTPRRVTFTARPLHRFSVLPSREWSVNTFITGHFTPIGGITLDGERYEGKRLERLARRVVCRVEDGGFVYEIRYESDQAMPMRLTPWGQFVRLQAVWYEGRRRRISEQTLRRWRLRGSVRVLKTP